MKLGPTVRCVLLSLVLCATSVAQTEPSSLLRLTAERPGDTRSVDLHLNDRIELAGTVVNVVSIRPWRGLVERNTGAALIHFSVRPGDHEWLHDQVLKDGDRIVLDDRLAITFMWAEEDSSPPKPRAFRGRWGVREGERTTWSESWVPGSGFTLVDGSEVTLLERSGDGTIRVQIDQSVRRRVLDVPPKTESPEGIINDGVQPTALVIDMTATAGRRIRAHVQSGDSAESFDLSPGQVFNWSGYALQVHDARDNAVYVRPESSPWLESILEVTQPDGAVRLLRLRERMLERVGEWRLRVDRGTVGK